MSRVSGTHTLVHNLSRPNLHELVVSRLLQIITTSGLQPGQAVPPERELAEQLGVSRNALRQGFRVLEDRGLISTRQGSGRYLRPAPATSAAGLTDALQMASVVDILEARRILEQQVVALACERRSAEEARQLTRLAERLESWDDNLNFHVAVAAASHNFMLERLVRQLAELSGQLGQRDHYADPQELDRMRGEHRAMAATIVARDLAAAVRLAVAHISRTASIIQDQPNLPSAHSRTADHESLPMTQDRAPRRSRDRARPAAERTMGDLSRGTGALCDQLAKIVELTYYPIKGCAGTTVRNALVTPAGITYDRSFMVIGEDGVFRSQRRDPKLALIHPEVSAAGELLTLRAVGAGELRVEVDHTAARRGVQLHDVASTGIDQGDAVAEWLSQVLSAQSRLVRVPREHNRVTGGETPGTAAYADSHAVLVTSLSSLDALNARIIERGGQPVPMNRFRPNIVVCGWDEPHVEDRVRGLRAGDAELGYAKLAARCVVTTVDQDSGSKAGPEPLRTLASYRRAAAGGVAFGVKFAVVQPGELSVGHEVRIISWDKSELQKPGAKRVAPRRDQHKKSIP